MMTALWPPDPRGLNEEHKESLDKKTKAPRAASCRPGQGSIPRQRQKWGSELPGLGEGDIASRSVSSRAVPWGSLVHDQVNETKAD